MSELNDFLSLIAEAKKQSPVEQVKENAKADLGNIFAQLAEEKRKDPVAQKVKQIEKQVSESVKSDLGSLFAQLASIQQRVEILPEETEGKAEAQQILAEVMLEPESPVVVPEEVKEEIGVDMAEVGKYLTGKTFQQPNPDAPSKDIDDIRQKIKYLEQWLGKIAAHGPGSGEVNFRYLDDVNRGTMTPSNDNWVLEYDSTTKKVQFTENIGPIRTIKFNTAGYQTPLVPGQIGWNAIEDCLDIRQLDESTLQVGLEHYIQVLNNTGATLLNGDVVVFSGVDASNPTNPVVEVTKYLADSISVPLYIVGVLTREIEDGGIGRATVFGKVRDINTTGSSVSETWAAGDLLWAHPTQAGKLTKVRPTAPNVATSIAAVLKLGTTDGILLVRPTIWPRLFYGDWYDTTNQTAALANTGYAVKYNNSGAVSGFELVGNDTIRALNAGRYNFEFTLQFTSSNSSTSRIYVWYRKNGTDAPHSTRVITVASNGGRVAPGLNYPVLMNANDTFTLMWAVDSTSVSMTADVTNSFHPTTPSVILTVSQTNL